MDNNQSPASAPAGDSAAGGQPASPQGDAPSGDQQPPATDLSQSPGGDQAGDQQSQVSIKELNDLKRKAGRWDARLESDRKARRQGRRANAKDDYNADDVDPALLDSLRDRDDKINELSSANIRLEVKDRVRDIMENDEYKDLPTGIKRAVSRNPLGFANQNSQSIEDVIADIQDYCDDELDRIALKPGQNPAENQGGNQPAADSVKQGQQQGDSPSPQAPAQQTPPAGGSGPSKPDATPFAGTEGMVGSKRSTTILQNILKARK